MKDWLSQICVIVHVIQCLCSCLTWSQVAGLGYEAQGCEFSFYMLIASSFMLNCLVEQDQWVGLGHLHVVPHACMYLPMHAYHSCGNVLCWVIGVSAWQAAGNPKVPLL